MNPETYEEMELFFSVMFNAPVPALQPNYIQCKRCPVRNTCGKVQKDGRDQYKDVNCVIEQDMLITLLYSLHEHDVQNSDKPLLLPLIQNMFRMKRFYSLESTMDLRRILNDELQLKMYKDKLAILNKSEVMYLKIMKELMATKKESYKQKMTTVQNIPTNLANLLSGDIDNANEDSSTNDTQN